MIRFVFIITTLTPLMSGQTAGGPETSPIEVNGRISQIDPRLSGGMEAGPGLFMKVHNTSTKAIQGYVYETFFVDPATGKKVGGHREHSVYKESSKGAVLTAGESKESAKPYPLPIMSSGSIAQYSFKIDLVIFDDGSRWGPGQLVSSQKLLANLSATK